MNEKETAIYNAIKTIRNTLSVDNVTDNEEIRFCLESLKTQLLKTIGKRIIRESRTNG